MAAAIEQVMVAIAKNVLDGEGSGTRSPRGANDQVYLDQLDRIVLKDKRTPTSFSSTSSVRWVAILTRVMQLVHGVELGIHVTKRDLFYTDVKLFKDQKDWDAVLDDIVAPAGCCSAFRSRRVASEKGVVVGKLVYNEDGDEIDCTKMGIGGKAIPSNIDKVTNFRSDAKFVLLVEKDARCSSRLAEDRFYNRFPCVIITAKANPDVATRLFLSKLKRDLRIPVLALVDADPYGLKIISVYMQGSKNMAFDDSGERRAQRLRHQVAGRAAVGPGQVQHPRAVPAGDVGEGYRNRAAHAEGGFHPAEPSSGSTRWRSCSRRKRRGARRSRALPPSTPVPVRLGGVLAAEAAARGLDLRRAKCRERV